MGKAQDTGRQPVQQTANVKVHIPFARQLKVVADRRGMTMGEVLDRYCSGAVSREYRKVVDEMQQELGGEGG